MEAISRFIKNHGYTVATGWMIVFVLALAASLKFESPGIFETVLVITVVGVAAYLVFVFAEMFHESNPSTDN